jgi:hypothetical protein
MNYSHVGCSRNGFEGLCFVARNMLSLSFSLRYPNIILTNRLQPPAMVTPQVASHSTLHMNPT